MALSSLNCGGYPREHGLRVNSTRDLALPTLGERFSENGYTNLGFSANLCPLMYQGFEDPVCANSADVDTAEELDDQEALDQDLNDQQLLDAFSERIPALGEDEAAFIWVHLNQSHSPYTPVSPWFETFHPEAYKGDLDVSAHNDLYQVALGTMEYDDDDRRYLEATYASEVRATDERFQGFLDVLDAAGRLDDAVIVLGSDHGEELLDHYDYAYHGCSPYDGVLAVDFAIRAPGQLPEGLEVSAPISLTDIAPTLVELAGSFEWTGEASGRSLVQTLQAGEEPSHDVFFERSTDTAGIVRGDWKFILTPKGSYKSCSPYNDSSMAYPAEVRELYNIGSDPEELQNLALEEAEVTAELEQATCDWVNESSWVPDYLVDANQLVSFCTGSTERR